MCVYVCVHACVCVCVCVYSTVGRRRTGSQGSSLARSYFLANTAFSFLFDGTVLHVHYLCIIYAELYACVYIIVYSV